MRNISIIAIAVILFISCKQKKAENNDKIVDHLYSNSDLGWAIEIPKNWTIIQTDKIEQNGKAAIEEVQGKFNTSDLKHLIGFQKDEFNTFLSTSEEFTPRYTNEWEDNLSELKTIIYNTYTEQGIKVDTSSYKTPINNLDFEVFHTILYNLDGDIILHQEIYTQWINGYDFAVYLNYNNATDEKVMKDMWLNSTFEMAF
ncbi:hypothetical protein [Saccharicrinis aurantiacus]|uniref:hypothetical protein n=1 Tax=Saccharicrinis aurantiacus TaxID=1849719 RepID=UPI00094F60F8|nr:hypothetical protein [Saccharicrinis aurantiacus]